MKLPAAEIYEVYADRIFAAAFSICRCSADADDVVQDTFIQYCRYDREFENMEHIKAWLLRVAINRAKDISMSFWRRNTVPWEEYMESLTFEETGDSALFEAVMSLPERYRIAIHLFYYEDYSIGEIAKLLNLREGSVKSRLSRGRKLLKNSLMEDWNDDE